LTFVTDYDSGSKALLSRITENLKIFYLFKYQIVTLMPQLLGRNRSGKTTLLNMKKNSP